jgi:hypothetical protein
VAGASIILIFSALCAKGELFASAKLSIKDLNYL